MKKLIVITTIAVLTTLTANAGVVSSWSDDFTGADGDIVATTANWDATNINWQSLGGAGGWGEYSRTGSDDEYIISNNTFYSYVGPCTLYTNVSLNQKVQVSFIPKNTTGRISLPLTVGSNVTVEVDLENIWANAGNMWGMNQEMKIVLSCSPEIADPHQSTNEYHILIKMRNSTDDYSIYGGYGYTGVDPTDFAQVDYAAPVTPKSIKLVVMGQIDGNTGAKLYVDDVLIGSQTGAFTVDAMQSLHPYIWYGKFTGSDPTIADGGIFIDNYSVAASAIPEPAVFFITGLAVLLIGLKK